MYGKRVLFIKILLDNFLYNALLVFVEYNDLYEKNVHELEKLGFSPITLFKIEIEDKDRAKKDLNNIKENISNLKPKYVSIEVFLKKIDNSTASIINNLKKDFDILIGYGGMNKINRYFLEQTNIDFLLDPHNSSYYNKIDFIHHFNSGLNHVLLTSAKQNKISLFISLNFSLNSKKIIPKEIGRINQNIKFARKYNIPIYINYIVSSPEHILAFHDLKKSLSIFDISNAQLKEMYNLPWKIVEYNRFKKSDSFINDYISFEN